MEQGRANGLTVTVAETPDTTVEAAPFQVMPPLSAEEYAALRADIAERGVRVPVDVDEHGRVLDGHHRQRIAAEVGVQCPTRVVAGLDEDGKRGHAFAVNLVRRQLGPITWAAAFREVAAARGVELGRGSRNDRTSVTVSEVAAGLGVDARTARRRLALADKLADHPDLAARVDAGDMDSKAAISETHRRRRAAHPPPVPMPPGDPRINLRHGDMRQVLADLEPGSVDLVFTDPPYDAAGMPSYTDLGKFAAQALKPGGLVVAYSGLYQLPEAMGRLADHLGYWWVYVAAHNGDARAMHPRRVHQCWKPLLVYRRPGGPPPPYARDMCTDGKREKAGHPWQQALAEPLYWIGELTEPGELVVDPFLGSGTTAVACRDLGRRFVGCDVDPAAVHTARERLRNGEAV